MTARFVLDESSWETAAEADLRVLSEAIHQFLDRLDVTRVRNESVVKHADYVFTDLGQGVHLYAVLFERDCHLQLDRDLAHRLFISLDQIDQFDDSGLPEYNAFFAGRTQFAPGAVWAHASCLKGHHVAVLPLPLRDALQGRIQVTVAGDMNDVFFVVKESHHLEFFRALISLENANPAEFEDLAGSAFPALEWADRVWSGLRHFSRPYVDVRNELVRGLSGLSDYGAESFCTYRQSRPDHLPSVLSAKIGFATSDENGRTKSHTPARLDRTRRHCGTDKVFWWHVKLQLHVDRIYFRYESPAANPPIPHPGRIVVGVFKHHCVLP